MRVIELIIDEEQEFSGIEAISIVDKPAIQEDFIALSKQDKVQLADVDTDKRILMGAALIPNKNIYRQDSEEEEGYYIYFSEKTVKKASELFLIEGNQNKSTLEHQAELSGLSVVESWIVEDEVHDKSRKYGLEMPVGTWMVSMKVNNENVWQDYVKTGAVKGFSIEGYFSEAVSLSVSEEVELKSFSDYPDSVKNNAKRALKWAEENGWGSCGTGVGKQRANQLANGEAISMSTIKRMYSYLSRHAPDLDSSKSYEDGCGKLMYDAWGGKSALSWAKTRISREENMSDLTEEEAKFVLSKLETIIANKLNELKS
jgi:hypothetical protein